MKDIISLLSKAASFIFAAVLFFCKFLANFLKKAWKFIILLVSTKDDHLNIKVKIS